jgi:hypothetical protein
MYLLGALIVVAVLDIATALPIGLYVFRFLVAVVVHEIVAAFYYQGWLGAALQRDLGFRECRAYLFFGRWRHHSAVAIEAVDGGGVFALAGFRKGDVFPELSHTDLFKMLHRHRGRVAELTVVDGGKGPPFCERPRRVIRFTVPPKRSRKRREEAANE